ncbi:MAG: hypothetical protein E6K54_05965 [Gammaproteobacteria bacterium]|nr:MAG: hypothetical protein E6K54_05965 [Gammaproteobacteria bacterium]
MPKKIKKTKSLSLFGCFRSPIEKEEMLISKPNTLNDLETQTLKEVKQKIAMIEKLEKTYEQQHLLALMKSIKNFSEKEKTFEKIGILQGMIAMYEEKKTDWNKFPSIPSAVLVAPIQNTPKISLFQQQLQIQATKLKPVNKIELQEDRQITKQENGQVVLVLKPDDLARNKLKPVQSSVMSNKKEGLSELDKLLAKRKVISENINTVNTDNVTCKTEALLKSNVVCLSKEEELDNFEFFEKVCSASGFSNNEFDSPSRFINALSKILEDTTLMDELDELLKNLQEFLYEPENEQTRSSQTSVSMHFKPTNDKPIIVEETLKSIPKI